MVTEAIDFRFVLIDKYKKLKLTEEELAMIFVIDFLIDQGNPFITPDLLSLKMTLDIASIDQLLTGLLKKGYIEYVSVGKKTVTSLEPLKKALFREFQLTMSFEDLESKKIKENSLQNIYAKFEELLNRPLSKVEFGKIDEWLTSGYTEETIIEALKEAISRGKKSLRSVDKVLLQWSVRDDLEQEGHTPISKDWTKNLAETIRIAKTPWMGDDEK